MSRNPFDKQDVNLISIPDLQRKLLLALIAAAESQEDWTNIQYGNAELLFDQQKELLTKQIRLAELQTEVAQAELRLALDRNVREAVVANSVVRLVDAVRGTFEKLVVFFSGVSSMKVTMDVSMSDGDLFEDSDADFGYPDMSPIMASLWRQRGGLEF